MDLGLLSYDYAPSQSLILTTDTDRTHGTGLAFADGLYPLTNYSEYGRSQYFPNPLEGTWFDQIMIESPSHLVYRTGQRDLYDS